MIIHFSPNLLTFDAQEAATKMTGDFQTLYIYGGHSWILSHNPLSYFTVPTLK